VIVQGHVGFASRAQEFLPLPPERVGQTGADDDASGKCNCPYRDAVRKSQQIVCTLHRGMTRGLLDAVSPETKLAAFVPRDPGAAGCEIQFRGELADEAAARG
jgi:predicted ArsR family transcriptional regulator